MTGKELFDLMEEIAAVVLGEKEKWDDLDSEMQEIMEKSAAKLLRKSEEVTSGK